MRKGLLTAILSVGLLCSHSAMADHQSEENDASRKATAAQPKSHFVQEQRKVKKSKMTKASTTEKEAKSKHHHHHVHHHVHRGVRGSEESQELRYDEYKSNRGLLRHDSR